MSTSSCPPPGRLRRSTAAVATTALAAGTLAFAAAPITAAERSAAADDRPIDKSFTYNCHVVAGGLSLGKHDVGVRAQVEVPESANPGEVVPSRTTQITLTMPESLRNATVGLLGGKTAGGKSEDAAVVMALGGQTQSYLIDGLSAPQTPIPQKAGGLWKIPTEGTVPAITVPELTGTATLSMPEQFFVNAVVYTEPEGLPAKDLPATMDCTGPTVAADRILTAIEVEESSPTPIAKDVDAGKVGRTAFDYGPKVPVTLRAVGGRAPYTFAVVTKPGAAIVTIDGATAVLSTTAGGAASFTYTATDADGQVSPPATVTYEGVNNAPLVRDLHFTIGKGKALDLWPYVRDDAARFYFWQQANDSQRITYGAPKHGALSPFLTAADVTADGWTEFPDLAKYPSVGHKQTYTPKPTFVGTDTFTYTATDNEGASATATITVDVVEETAVRGVLDGVRYKCQPQERDFETGEEVPGFTELQNYVMGGSMAFTVDTRADLPRSIAPGEVFTPEPTDVDLVMPQGLAELLAGNNTLDTMGFGQTKVGGSSIASVHLEETATGHEYDAPLEGLRAEDVNVSWPVPSEGVRIPTTGTLDAVTGPDKGAIKVSAPQEMAILSKLTPGIMDGLIPNVWLQCAAMPGQDLHVATVYVKGDSTTTAKVGPVSYGAAPVVDVTVASDNAAEGTVEVRAGDKVVGTGTVKGGKARVTLPKAAKVGAHEVEVAYLGFDGAKPSSTTASYSVTKAASTTTATARTSAYGASPSVSVAVRTVAGAKGKVEVRRGAQVVGSATVSGGRATVAVRKGALAPGKHALTIAYRGDAISAASSGRVSVTVTKARAAVRAKVAPTKVRAKRTKAKVSVQVTTPTGVARTGKVVVTVKGKKIGTATVRANGKVVVRLKKFAKPGTYKVKVAYAGNVYAAGKTVTVKVKVRK
ncbi:MULTISPECIES: DUF6801 domain-containing protein [Mumia]|uniref:DUF6801 domain-containing protein n=1 Tax=Mumia TaxID=1546255 RepID=UPI001422753B|nr:DUF6801 domain-containing protein [Mumia sp. ZJ1417]QMW66405.1 Ig-like domain repeat protein [Mumia sp. ZJ1417]